MLTKPLPTAAFGFGQTRHARQWPAVNAFAIGSAFVRLPMRHLASQAPQRLGTLFGVNLVSPIGFRDRDHGLRSAEHGSALAWVDGILHSHGISDASGETWLHTFPRVLGYAFKPVSFWFCHTQSGALRAVLAEVHNTFGEQHCYLLAHTDGSFLHNGQAISARKVFHVSPFFPVRGDYQFRWLVSDAHSVIRIDYYDALHKPNATHEVTLSTSISGEHRPMTALACLGALLAYPAQAFSVVARIHWQALKLWFKRATFHRKPKPPAQAVTVSSIPKTIQS
jgi:uncharacterized protein